MSSSPTTPPTRMSPFMAGIRSTTTFLLTLFAPICTFFITLFSPQPRVGDEESATRWQSSTVFRPFISCYFSIRNVFRHPPNRSISTDKTPLNHSISTDQTQNYLTFSVPMPKLEEETPSPSPSHSSTSSYKSSNSFIESPKSPKSPKETPKSFLASASVAFFKFICSLLPSSKKKKVKSVRRRKGFRLRKFRRNYHYYYEPQSSSSDYLLTTLLAVLLASNMQWETIFKIYALLLSFFVFHCLFFDYSRRGGRTLTVIDRVLIRIWNLKWRMCFSVCWIWLGTSGNPLLGEQAADESKEDIANALKGLDLVFITAGMGGVQDLQCW